MNFDNSKAIVAKRATAKERAKAAILAKLAPKGGKLADPNGAWGDVRLWVFQYRTDQEIRQAAKNLKGLGSDERKRKLANIVGALKEARTLTEEALKNPDLAHDLIAGWADGYGAATQVLFEPSFKAEIEQTMKGLLRLEHGVKLAAAQRVRRVGAPGGRSKLPVSMVKDLAAIFERRSRREAKQGKGPFFRFARAILDRMDVDISDDLLLETITDALSDGKRSKRKAERRRERAQEKRVN
jgi:hypothetical protein